MAVKLDASIFYKRLDRLYDVWEKSAPLSSLSTLSVASGQQASPEQEEPARKTQAIQMWMLGYQFPNTVFVFERSGGAGLGKGKLTALASGSKAKLLNSLLPPPAESLFDFEVFEYPKDPATHDVLWGRIVDLLRKDGNKFGGLPKDVARASGKFMEEWKTFYEKAQADGPKLEEVDVTSSIADVLSTKDERELSDHLMASKMSMVLMDKFCNEMSTIIDKEQKVTHESLAHKIEAKLDDPKVWNGSNLGKEFDPELGDWGYTPIIQSGGNYDLRYSAESDSENMKSGIILCSLGMKYRSYCSNVGRTFIIDPHPTQEQNYRYLIDLQKWVLSQMAPGKSVKDFFQAVVDKVSEEKPDLVEHFVAAKTLGFLTGLEFRDSAYAITPKCTKEIQSGQVYALSLSFGDIPDPKSKGKTYSLSLIDTIKVTPNGAALLSDGFKGKDDFLFHLNDEAPSKPKSKANNGKAASPKKSNGVAIGAGGVRSKLRNETREIDTSAADARKAHQKELAAKVQEEGMAKYRDGGGGDKDERQKTWRRFESYARENQLPKDVAGLRIVVDIQRKSVILPINGYAVPFHISTIKNAIKQEEGQYTLIRFMFITPGQITGKKEDTPFQDVNANFIRNITFRSTDGEYMTEIHKAVMELRKNATKREMDEKNRADLVEQPDLEEGKGPRRIRLNEVTVRPPFEGKRSAGDVEIHRNGIRYVSQARADHKIDIVFSNIKHLFFQPCDNELVVIVHVHLKHPIFVGKKKTRDIQFFREASEAAFDETGNRKRRRQMHDEDEIEQEQEERRHRARLNKEFKAFADKIAENSDGQVEVDIPIRELGFNGVPHRANVYLQPTMDALVYLSDLPFLVVTLGEVEVAHLERVQFGLKAFDLVFVFKDYTKQPHRISTIPVTALDSVKEWLDSVDICFSEGPVNLTWPQIMKTVNDDPYEFFKEGGWSFLQPDSDAESSEDDSDEESAFEVDSDELNMSDEDDSVFEDDASDEDDDSEFDDEDDSGMDSDEMDRKARESDKKKGKGRRSATPESDEDSEDDRRKKSKAKGKKR